ETIRQATRNEGVDVVFELTGAESGFFNAMTSLRRGGDFRLIGAPSFPVSIDLTQWLRTGPTLYNIHGRRVWRSWQQASDLVLDGQVDLSPLISHILPLQD